MLTSSSYCYFAGNLNIAMNFLIRAAHPVVPEVSNVTETENHKGVTPISKQTSTLEGLIAEDPFQSPSTGDDADTDSDVITDVGSSTPAPTSKNQGNHTDVLEDDGWITIPYSMSTCISYHFFKHLKSHIFISIRRDIPGTWISKCVDLNVANVSWCY